jgi:uncharacterized membrane protein
VLNSKKILSLSVVAAAVAISAVAYPRLPAIVPTHWGISGNPNRLGSRLELALLAPCLMLAIAVVFAFVPHYDRYLFIRYRDRGSTLDPDSSTARPEYDTMISIILTFMLAMHTFAVASGLGLIAQNQRPVLIAAIISIGMIAIGNYMPRITRRNAFLGVRLPWTYASEEVWRRTQRIGGYGMVAAGIVGVVGAIAVPSSPVKPLFAAVFIQLVVVAAYSYYLAHSSSVS